MKLSATHPRRVVFALAAGIGALALACGGAPKPADHPAGDGASSAAGPSASGSAVAGAGAEGDDVFVEEVSNAGGDKTSAVRSYSLDVTREDRVASPTAKDAGAAKVLFLRVQVKFPVPKVVPVGAREPHAINRGLWESRSEIAKCYYGKKGSGPGGNFGEERGLVAALTVDKSGAVTDASIEKADDALKNAPGFTDCVLANVKGSSFGPAGDETKIRFKLKFQTLDGAGLPDFKAPPPKPAG
jgi:hypothetical protein